MLKTGSEAQKDAAARLIRHVAHRVATDFVVVLNAKSLLPDKAHRFEEISERYGSVGALPYRIGYPDI